MRCFKAKHVRIQYLKCIPHLSACRCVVLCCCFCFVLEWRRSDLIQQLHVMWLILTAETVERNRNINIPLWGSRHSKLMKCEGTQFIFYEIYCICWTEINDSCCEIYCSGETVVYCIMMMIMIRLWIWDWQLSRNAISANIMSFFFIIQKSLKMHKSAKFKKCLPLLDMTVSDFNISTNGAKVTKSTLEKSSTNILYVERRMARWFSG